MRVRNEYHVDGGDAVIAGRARSLKDQMRHVAHHDLYGIVIPAIDAAINDANRQIARLQEEERQRRIAEERRRREEEERRRREEEERRRQEEANR